VDACCQQRERLKETQHARTRQRDKAKQQSEINQMLHE